MPDPLTLVAIALIRALGPFRTAELVRSVGITDLSDAGCRDLAELFRVLAGTLSSSVPAAAAVRGQRTN